jgi:hypothetical protein
VTLEELDIALEELEVRLERLRALYEQYFLGFEKIEPSVARKDVDRRIYILRREKIRNTGKRFKLQTIIQRYNTFQQYWQRICREIENGTYRRHVLRAERQMSPDAQLTIAAKRRFGKFAAAGDATSARASSAPPGGFSADEAATTEIARHSSRAPTPSSKPPDSGDVATNRPPPMTPAELGQKRVPPRKPERLQPASSRPPTPPDKYDSLELDMGFLGSWVPGAPEEKQSSPRAAAPPKVASPRAAAVKPKSAPQAAPAPKPAPPPKAGPPPKPARGPELAPSPNLSDDRVKDLHQRLSALKRENREAGQVSFETLAKTVRETEAKLRAQHKDRKIDFEVVIRDGKAIVKPTVR